jgi:hypothetical protein
VKELPFGRNLNDAALAVPRMSLLGIWLALWL